MWEPDPGRRELGPVGDEYQQPHLRHSLDKKVEQLARSGIAPMYVLKDHQHGVPQRQTLALSNQRLKCLLLPLLRCKLERRVSLTSWNRQQVRE